jgi:hypothetical protein
MTTKAVGFSSLILFYLLTSLVADAATLRSQRPDWKLELLCDGAPEMWNLWEEGFLPKFGNDLHRLVDLHHVLEKLGAAARVIDDSRPAGERLRRWKMSRLNRARAATGILEELTASGRDEGVGTDHPVHAASPISRVIAPPPIIGTTPERADWAWRLVLARRGDLPESVGNPYEALRRTMEGGDRSALVQLRCPGPK